MLLHISIASGYYVVPQIKSLSRGFSTLSLCILLAVDVSTPSGGLFVRASGFLVVSGWEREEETFEPAEKLKFGFG